MFSRTSTSKVSSSHQNTYITITISVENEIRVDTLIVVITPIKKQKLSKSTTLYTFQKLLGNNLIRILLYSRMAKRYQYNRKGFHGDLNLTQILPVVVPIPLNLGQLSSEDRLLQISPCCQVTTNQSGTGTSHEDHRLKIPQVRFSTTSNHNLLVW